MKLVIDEKQKHRLIGLAVIISLGAIFAPAVMKKSSQRLENSFSVNVKLPPKPLAPDVVLTDEKEMFKTIKVAKVQIQPVSEERQLTELVKAEPVKSDAIHMRPTQEIATTDPQAKAESTRLALNEAANNTAKKTIKNAVIQPARQPAIALKQDIPPKKPVKTAINIKAAPPAPKKQVARSSGKSPIRKDLYAVQLASFSQLTNAQALVNKLRTKGYKANFIKAPAGKSSVYKVYVGHSPSKLDVMRLKTQLASAMQLNGFVVNTGVS